MVVVVVVVVVAVVVVVIVPGEFDEFALVGFAFEVGSGSGKSAFVGWFEENAVVGGGDEEFAGAVDDGLLGHLAREVQVGRTFAPGRALVPGFADLSHGHDLGVDAAIVEAHHGISPEDLAVVEVLHLLFVAGDALHAGGGVDGVFEHVAPVDDPGVDLLHGAVAAGQGDAAGVLALQRKAIAIDDEAALALGGVEPLDDHIEEGVGDRVGGADFQDWLAGAILHVLKDEPG